MKHCTLYLACNLLITNWKYLVSYSSSGEKGFMPIYS